MNEIDHRDEIVWLEEQIDELAARIESCRKFILAGKIAPVAGSLGLISVLGGAIQFDPSVMGGYGRGNARRHHRCRIEPQHGEGSNARVDRGGGKAGGAHRAD